MLKTGASSIERGAEHFLGSTIELLNLVRQWSLSEKDVADIERSAEHFLGFVTNLMTLIRQKGVSFDVIYRLVTDAGSDTLARMVDLAYVDWMKTTGAFPFVAPVVYAKPDFEDLKRRFGYIDPRYRRKRFESIDRCKSVNRENREVAFMYVSLGDQDNLISEADVFLEMDRKRLRPALYEELLGFAKKYPDEAADRQIVALGSKTRVNRGFSFPMLQDAACGRGLDLIPSEELYKSFRFLGVCE